MEKLAFPFPIILKFLFHLLKTFFWKTNRWTEFPSTGSAIRCLQKSILGWAKTVSQKLNPGLPCGWQGPNCLSHYHCLPGSAIAGSWRRQPECDLEPRYSNVGCGCPSQHVNHQVKSHPLFHLSKQAFASLMIWKSSKNGNFKRKGSPLSFQELYHVPGLCWIHDLFNFISLCSHKLFCFL